MRLLLDTHALLWWWQGNSRLSQVARRAIAGKDAEVHVSAATAWELATKVRLGKLPEARRLTERFEEGLMEQGFLMLPISVAHGHRAGWLKGSHKDPFDRMLAAQALIEDCAVVTNDEKIARFDVRTIW